MSVVGGQAPQEDRRVPRERDPSTEETVQFTGMLGHVPADIRDVSFATSVRGYDRREVDAYVERVNQVIAELEVGRSPQAAVKHALDRVGQQTSGVLQRAREVAEELTATALAEADHVTRRANVEAEEMVEKAQLEAQRLHDQSKEEAEDTLARAEKQATDRVERCAKEAHRIQEEAEKRLSAVRADIDAAGDARRDLLEELRQTAARLQEFASGMLAGTDETGAKEEGKESPTETMPTARLPGAPPAAPDAASKGDGPRTSSGPSGRARDPMEPRPVRGRAGQRERPTGAGASRDRR